MSEGASERIPNGDKDRRDVACVITEEETTLGDSEGNQPCRFRSNSGFDATEFCNFFCGAASSLLRAFGVLDLLLTGLPFLKTVSHVGRRCPVDGDEGGGNRKIINDNVY